MRNVFEFFGGRKYAYTLLGIGLVILWQFTGWEKTDLLFTLSLLGLGVAGNAFEDGMKRNNTNLENPHVPSNH